MCSPIQLLSTLINVFAKAVWCPSGLLALLWVEKSWGKVVTVNFILSVAQLDQCEVKGSGFSRNRKENKVFISPVSVLFELLGTDELAYNSWEDKVTSWDKICLLKALHSAVPFLWAHMVTLQGHLCTLAPLVLFYLWLRMLWYLCVAEEALML